MANDVIGAPYMAADVDCWEIAEDGTLRKKWSVHCPRNVVQNAGKGALLNKAFGGQTQSSVGLFLVPISAATGSTYGWGDVSASRLGSYESVVPRATFATTYAGGSATGTATYGFSAGTQTLSGFAGLWYTATSLATSNLSATGDLLMYNYGTVVSQQIAASNTVSVSITLSVS